MKDSNYPDIGRQLGALVAMKQQAYGDSFGKSSGVLKLLYPDGIPPESYEDVLTIVRVVDKLFRIAANDDPFNEDPWSDIAGYAILSLGRNHAKKQQEADILQ